jgi:Pyruvate/2-oxoacid:ferredoxin oxidoreductase delta subunit
MDRPCIVCQENCPVSPKAIKTRVIFNSIAPELKLIVDKADATYIELRNPDLVPAKYATGDYYCAISSAPDRRLRRIVSNWERGLKVHDERPFEHPPTPGSIVDIRIRLQRPYVDPQRCIGCGVCEHECPVPGKRAIRVTAAGESRERMHTLLLHG